MSRDDLAARLHLPLRAIEALENDRFDLLPEPPYVRGYLRSCAKVLEVDAEPMIRALELATGSLRESLDITPVAAGNSGKPGKPSPRADAPIPTASSSSSSRPWVMVAVLVLLAGLVVGLFLYAGGLFQESVEPADGVEDTSLVRPQPAPSVTSEIQLVITGDVSDSPVAAVAAVPPPEEDAAPSAEAITATLPEAPSGGRAAAPVDTEPAPPTGRGRLVLRFEEDSWVEIIDAGGERLLVGLMRKGSERRIEGATPVRVFLGNAPGVRVTFNGQPMDMSGDTRADNTARFTVGRR